MRDSRFEPTDTITKLREIIVDERYRSIRIAPVAVTRNPVGGVFGKHRRPFRVASIVEETRLAIE